MGRNPVSGSRPSVNMVDKGRPSSSRTSSANRFIFIAGMNPHGRVRIETRENAMQATAAPLFPPREPGANLGTAFGAGEETFEQRPQVKAGSTHHHRGPVAAGDFSETSPGQARIVAGGEDLSGFEHIQQMMRNPAPLGCAQLGSPQVEAPVNLQRVTADNFASQGQGDG